MHPESGDHFVEYEHNLRIRGEFPQSFQESVSRRNHTHIAGHRLHDDRRDLVPVLRHDPLYRLEVVVWRGEGIPRRARGHAGAAGHARGERRRPRLNQKAVGVPVPAALELDHLLAARISPGQAHGRHRSLGARIHHAHHFHTGYEFGDQPGHFNLRLSGRPETRTLLAGPLEPFNDAWRRVAQNQRSPRTDVVDVFPSVRVVNLRSASTGYEQRLAADRAERPRRAVHAPRNHPLRRFE